MNRVIKILLAIVILLGLLIGAVFLFKGDDLKRLSTVNTLFDADVIVDNFSNMDRAFMTRSLTVESGDDWTVNVEALPETVDIAGTERQLEDVLNELDTTALVIIRDGELIHESYYRGTGPDDLRISWSVAKSFMSGLYGKALAEGDIASLDDEVTTYVPDLKGTAYEGASLRNILNMSSGIRFNEDYMDQGSDINKMGRTIALGGSLDKYTTTLKDRVFDPGTNWQYVSMDTHVGAWALRNATGKSLHELWEETYGSLGFKQTPFYLTDGEGVAFALGGLNLTTRDYAKFGQLFLQNGQWKGEQLIPADWVAASIVHSAPAMSDRGVGYGYQWWVPMPADEDYFAVGIYGQYVYVDPKTNIVIAKNAADREFAFADEVGTHSMNKNIELMRSLATQLDQRSRPNYFPDNRFTEFKDDWFSRILFALEADSLSTPLNENAVSMRLTHIPSFTRPALVQYELVGSKVTRRFAVSSGAGGYDPGSLIESLSTEIELEVFDRLEQLFDSINVCEEPEGSEFGMDGTTWVFEKWDGEKYCVVDVWQSSDPEPYTSIGLSMFGENKIFFGKEQ